MFFTVVSVTFYFSSWLQVVTCYSHCLSTKVLDCKTVRFFLKISKEIGKAWRKSLSVSPQSRSLFSALFQTFCLTARAYLNTQKYGLFCSLPKCTISNNNKKIVVLQNP